MNIEEKEVKNETNESKTDFGLIKSCGIEKEMQDAYLDYAMSVIVSRALPDVRDGLKPVHRRILYAMHQLGLTSKAKYRKSATVVGEVLGRYHPHGDIAVYDSLVRMAQDFAMRYPLIDGQGNFGSIDGDSPAAMRYTEVKMKTLSEELLFDIEKETIPFMDNYDGTTKEPVVLPSKLPNFLLGGTMGIAVGMATNVPPHNLSEVLDASMALIDNPELTTEDLLDYIKGPDFPTGGIIYDFKEIKEAYSTGKGRIVMRGVAEVNSSPSIQGERQQIIISEIPYNVNKADLVAKIADLVKNRKIEGVADLRDESDRDGIRVVIDLKRDAFAQKILNGLYKHTQLQETFHLNMLALVDGLLPRVLTLKVALEEWLKHRNNVVRKRCEFELKKAKERAHILEGLKKALDHLEEVIETIKKSKDRDNARNNLIKKFSLDVLQADAILDMRLAALAALERQRIIDELKEKLVLMAYLEDILAHPAKILGLIKEELKELKAKYGDERRTKVIKGAVGTFSDSDLIPNEEVIVTLTTSNYIKRTPVAIYHSQGRGGKGVIGMEINKEDGIRHLEATYNLDNILFFTNLGRVFQTKVYDIPVASRIAKGTALVNLIPLGPSEKVTSIVTIKEDQAGYLFMATKKGIVKKTSLSDYKSVRKNGLITIRLDIGDELCWVRVTGGEDDILLATEKGLGIRFRETNVRSMGRATRGVIGIRMKNEDMVVGMDIARKDNYILTVSEKGLGKRTPVRLFKTQTRGGMGVIAQRVNEKTGKIVAAHMTSDDVKDIILVSKTGQIIRIPYRRISSLGRATQGIRLMRLNVNDRVASVVYILKDMQEIEEKLNHKETLKPKKSKTIKTKSRSIAKTKVIKSNVKKKRIRTKPKKGITKPKIKEKSHIKVHTYEVVSKKADKLETNETKKSITKTITPNVKVHHYVKPAEEGKVKEELLSKPLFTKKIIKPKVVPRKTSEILRQIESKSKSPKGEGNYWGADKTVWKKK